VGFIAVVQRSHKSFRWCRRSGGKEADGGAGVVFASNQKLDSIVKGVLKRKCRWMAGAHRADLPINPIPAQNLS
jgi:hypothetical protein